MSVSAKQKQAMRKYPVVPLQASFSRIHNQTRVLNQEDPVNKSLAVDHSFTADVTDFQMAGSFVVRLQLTNSTAATTISNLNQLFETIQVYTGADSKDALITFRDDEL